MSHADPKVAPPIEAFQFKATSMKLAGVDASGRRKFEAVFYSGELIPNHWCWGNLVFDISTTKAKDITGVLLQHDPEKIVGSGQCSFGSEMRIEGLLSAKTEHAKFVADQADEGFPWQMSHFIEPGEIDQIQPGTKVTVNGREFTGPLAIFRHNNIRHVTFCADGADANTSATIFTRGVPTMTPAAPAAPTIESLTAEVARLTSEFNAQKKIADDAVAESKEFRKQRLTPVFKARGEEMTDAKLAPYLSMSAEHFNAALAFIPTPSALASNAQLFTVEGPTGAAVTPGKTGLVDSAKAMSAKKTA